MLLQHCFAFGRQDRYRHWLGLGRRQGLFQPPIQTGVTTVAGWNRFLRHARRTTYWTGQSRMEMVVVPIPGTYLAQPATVAAHPVAQVLLDVGIDEDAIDTRHLGHLFHNCDLPLSPKL